MPQVFKIAGYLVYFWADEGEPLEPIHVHVVQGTPTANATKIWITRKGRCLVANNRSKIPERILRDLCDVIEARAEEVIAKWKMFHKDVYFYC